LRVSYLEVLIFQENTPAREWLEIA
jgi:hypothetical protein